MRQLNLHNKNTGGDIPILIELKKGYKIWHDLLQNLPRPTRHSIGLRIDDIFTEVIEMTLTAEHTPIITKLPALEKTSQKFDLLKYFITMLWEMKVLEEKQYSKIVIPLTCAGKMLGGWIKEIKKQTPPNFSGGE